MDFCTAYLVAATAENYDDYQNPNPVGVVENVVKAHSVSPLFVGSGLYYAKTGMSATMFKRKFERQGIYSGKLQ